MSFAIERYQTTKVTTGSPIQLVVQLYDGAIRFLRRAVLLMNSRDYAGKGTYLNKAHAIVSELRVTLDHDQAPEISAELDRLYLFVMTKITEANLKCDPEIVKPAISILETLRSAWAEVAERMGAEAK